MGVFITYKLILTLKTTIKQSDFIKSKQMVFYLLILFVIDFNFAKQLFLINYLVDCSIIFGFAK